MAAKPAKSLAARINENTSGLLKQYLPTETDLSVYFQTHLNKVARQLNERPRKDLVIRNASREI